RREPSPRVVAGGDNRVHFRIDVIREDPAHDAAKIDSEILDARPIRHRKIGRYADQQFMQSEPAEPECGQLAQVQPAEIAELARLRHAGEAVLGSKDRAQVAQLFRHLRFDPGAPGTELGKLRGGVRHGSDRPSTAARLEEWLIVRLQALTRDNRATLLWQRGGMSR